MLFHSTFDMLPSFSTRYSAILLEPRNKVMVIGYALKRVTYTNAQNYNGPIVYLVVYLVDRPDEMLKVTSIFEIAPNIIIIQLRIKQH